MSETGKEPMTGTSKPEPAPAWTPGPWIAHTFLVMAGRDRITHVGGNLPPPRSHESEANARLIATAPELAAFVEKVRATIAPAVPGPAGDDYLNEGGHDAIAALVPEAEALLAKARGI